MPPSTSNPLVIAAYVVGILLSLPFLYALVKLIFFLSGATIKLDTVVTDVAQMKKDVGSLRHSVGDGAQEVELSLFVIENDVNALQQNAGLPVREYPDRRTGPLDRRTA